MPANVQSVAYYGEKPWHGLGTEVPERITAGEMIRAAGLDWEVKLRPARGARKINGEDFSRYEIVRVPRQNTMDREALFGVVSRRYEPLQNVEAFKFFDPIVGEGKAYYETAGALGDGEKIWVLARMPEPMEIVRGDECWKYLLLSNTHNGEGSVTVKFTPVRVVCQNTLILAMEDGQKAYRVRHSKTMMNFRLKELAEFLCITQDIFIRAGELFKRLAKVQMIEERLVHYLEAVFPRTENQKNKGKEPPKWTHIRELLEATEDLRLQGVRGTLWATYNAITRFEDYKQLTEDEQPEQRLERSWFGSGADVKLKALQKAQELSEAWLN